MKLHEKMLALMEEVKGEVVERDELVEAILIALLAGKNLFVLGETGQAKSYAINRIRARIEGATQFERLMSKQTDEEQLFGRIDLPSLIAGRPRLVTSGKIPEAHICFLDEIFKSNDGVLNSLLTALNERRWTNEGEVVEIPTISFFSASNEIPNFNNPEERILLPLYDRFDLKLVTEYVELRENRIAMLKKKQCCIAVTAVQTITLDELVLMQAAVNDILISDEINQLWDDVLCALRNKGIHVSDRKFLSFSPIVQAKAWLEGRNEVQSQDLMIMRHCLWTQPEQRNEITELLTRLCADPYQEKLADIHAMALEAQKEFEDAPDASDMENLRRLGKLRNELSKLTTAAENSCPEHERERALLQQFTSEMENINREASREAGRNYITLHDYIDAKMSS
jgi:MoxR-like ATPases